ncbi:MAG: permease-like cell division protein FtsX [Propionibacteriaceae bacterium]|jgi:cell division transport system permease protein|nr:permease-like cell division protein FtsX [Propionibacteriaceae bacterium]
MRHALTETWSGLKRNLGLTMAVVMTMWVSLSLFGAGMIAAQQVNLLKDEWYDRIEITVYLCTAKFQTDGACDPGQDATQEQKDQIRAAIESNPQVQEVFYQSKEEAYQQFLDVFKDNATIRDALSADEMQDSFRVKLVDPKKYDSLTSQIQSMLGVQKIQDLHQILDPVFKWLGALQWGTIGLSVLLLLAAAFQIGTAIRMATFTRGREIGIMRLVGASNFYIMGPFLLESLIAALIGAALAIGTLALGIEFIIKANVQQSLESFRWVGWHEFGISAAFVVVAAIVFSVIPTVISARRYLRV